MLLWQPTGGNQNLHAVSRCFFLTLARRASASNLSGLPAVALPCLLSDGPPATSLGAGPRTPTALWGLCPALPSLSESWQPPASHTVPVFFPALFPQDTWHPCLRLQWALPGAGLASPPAATCGVGHGWILFLLQIGLLVSVANLKTL